MDGSWAVVEYAIYLAHAVFDFDVKHEFPGSIGGRMNFRLASGFVWKNVSPLWRRANGHVQLQVPHGIVVHDYVVSERPNTLTSRTEGDFEFGLSSLTPVSLLRKKSTSSVRTNCASLTVSARCTVAENLTDLILLQILF
jgi:hypothetical protein